MASHFKYRENAASEGLVKCPKSQFLIFVTALKCKSVCSDDVNIEDESINNF